ncbi:hypothetical protein KAH37_02900 [bacterium]|nr:hypothetical protein [bacterium]
MKLKYLFLSLMIALIFSSCAPMQTRPKEQLAFNTVTDTLSVLHANKKYDEADEYIRGALTKKWATHEYDTLYFLLGKTLFYKKEYGKASRTLAHIKVPAQFPVRLPLLQTEIAYRGKEYKKALEQAFKAYLALGPQEKVTLSTYILMSYLYLEKMKEARLWYSKINREKKRAAEVELALWKAVYPQKYLEFIAKDEDAKKIEDGAAIAPDEIATEEEIALSEIFPVYTPDWNSLCIMLNEDAKWAKFNEVIKKFFTWYFKDFKKSNVVITETSFLTKDDVIKNFQVAVEKRCFAVVGPLFSEDFSSEFVAQSQSTSIPVLTYNRFIAPVTKAHRFFNFRFNEDESIPLVVKRLLSENEKTRFALVYIDNFAGRNLRDTYLERIRKEKGVVTNMLAIAPGDTGFLDDLDRIVTKPEGYKNALWGFKQRNAAKYSSSTLMARAVSRFNKLVPGGTNYDAVVFLLDSKQIAMIVPSFPYRNIEFNYHSRWEKFRIRKLNAAMRKLYPDWKVTQITAIFPQDVYYNKNFAQSIGKFIDGSVVAVPATRSMVDSKYHSEFVLAMQKGMERAPFAIEKRLADIAQTLAVLSEGAKEGEDIAKALATLLTAAIPSLTGGIIQFDDTNRFKGRGIIVEGRKGDGFLSASEDEALEKKKKSDKKGKKGGKPAKQSAPPKSETEKKK